MPQTQGLGHIVGILIVYININLKINVFSFAHKQQSELKTPNCMFKYMCSVDVNHSIYLSKCDKEKVYVRSWV